LLAIIIIIIIIIVQSWASLVGKY